MAVPDTVVVTITADTSQFQAALRRFADSCAAITDLFAAKHIAAGIVMDVLLERAREGGPVGRAAVAELEHRLAPFRIRHHLGAPS